MTVIEGRVVEARSRKRIEQIAAQARIDLGFMPGDQVSMAHLLQDALYDIVDGYEFLVVEDRKMGGAEALTDADRPTIRMKESVCRAMERGDGRARMTAAHELGHLLMHCRMPSYFALFLAPNPLRDPERQADIFGPAFLMPELAFRQFRNVDAIMNKFGISYEAALCRARRLRHRLSDPQKKGRSSLSYAL